MLMEMASDAALRGSSPDRAANPPRLNSALPVWRVPSSSPADLQIALRDDEAIVAVAQHLQARLRSLAQRRFVQQHAV